MQQLLSKMDSKIQTMESEIKKKEQENDAYFEKLATLDEQINMIDGEIGELQCMTLKIPE